jgi:SAM-dependent methyltransferase
MLVEWCASAAQLSELIGRIGEAWTAMGKDRPYYSVLSGPEFLPDNINETSEEHFWQTGFEEASQIEAILSRHGVYRKDLETCVEYGCGLGRVTFPLSRIAKKVHAYDISTNHLAIAKMHAEKSNIKNIKFEHVDGDIFHTGLQSCDFFYSRIVFQHNPPPLIAILIKLSLKALRPGGIAIFQVPTYAPNYQFQIREYLTSSASADMEMHCLPQGAIFELIGDASCQVLEVREDGSIGHVGEWISNTFIVRQAG